MLCSERRSVESLTLLSSLWKKKRTSKQTMYIALLLHVTRIFWSCAKLLLKLKKGEQGWRSGESACLPPMWPRFESRTGRQMWVEFVVGSRPCSERFLSGYSSFPLSSKTNISKFQFDLDTVDEERPCGCATANSHFKYFRSHNEYLNTSRGRGRTIASFLK